MRALFTLSAYSDCAWEREYEHRLHGRVTKALRTTKYDAIHDEDVSPGLCYSEVFPGARELDEGDEQYLIVSAVDGELLSHVVSDFQRDPILNLGSMRFVVEDSQILDPDVGTPGARGTLTTLSGIWMPMEPHDQFGCDHWGSSTCDLDDFRDRVAENVCHKAWAHAPDVPDTATDPFDSYELDKTYGIRLKVTDEFTAELTLSKWTFGYEVRDEDHRDRLNLLLDAGLGAKNAYGLGFMNIPPEEVSA